MMKSLTVRKVYLAVLSFIAALMLFMVGGIFVAKAEGETNTYNMSFIDGASVRVSSNGLRFKVKIDETTKNAIVENEDVTMGFFIAPTELMTAANGDYAAMEKKITIDVDENKIYSDGQGGFLVNGCVYNVLEENRNVNYSAIAFVKQNDEYVYSDLSSSRSIYSTLNSFVTSGDLLAEDVDRVWGVYEWLGNSTYPVKIDSADAFANIGDLVKSDITFDELYFNVTEEISVTEDMPSDFKGLFLASSKVVNVGDYTLEENQIYAPTQTRLYGVKIENGGGAKGSASYVASDASDDVYTGGYISLKSTTNTGNTTITLKNSTNLTERLTLLKNDGYNAVKIWVKVVSSQTSAVRNMWCAGVSPITYADIAVNEWVQIELPLTNFTTTYNDSVWLTSVNLNQNGVEELRIGNMYASNISYVYSPVENGTAGVVVENGSGADGSASYVAADTTRQGYTGGYISLTATATTGVTTLRFLKIPPVTERLTTIQNEAECTKVKVWVKVVSSNTSALRMSWCAGVSPITYVDVPVNEWVQIELPLSNFVTTYDKQVWQTSVNLNQNGVTEFCVGDISAVLPDYTYAENQIYAPAALELDGVKVENGGGATGSATYVAADTSREGYTDAYISLTAPATSTAGLTTIRVLKFGALTERLTKLQNEGYTKVKVWVKITSTGSGAVSMSCFGASGYNLSRSVEVNKWVQVELPMSNFVANYNAGVWVTYATLNQGGVTEFCLGNIIAEK